MLIRKMEEKTIVEENRIRHLEMIQNIITRMNTNSFQIKGLAITIVSAFIAIYASTLKAEFIIVAIAPTILFWCLDSYYLMMERRFRGLYNDVAGKSSELKGIKQFEMKPNLYTGGTYGYFCVMISKTIWPIYLLISGILFIIYLTIKCKQ